MITSSAEKLLLKNTKKTAGSLDSQLILPIGDPSKAYLRILSTQKNEQNEKDIIFITNCRNKYPKAFLTEFEATASQTSDWLSNYVSDDDSRILFMVDLPDGQTIGYMGLAFIDWEKKYGEADAIVRGIPAPKYVMSASLGVLLKWAQERLGLKEVGVRVLSDNPALKFYKKCGFIENKRVPLSKKVEGGKIVWFENEKNMSPSRSLVYHHFERS
ncbi:MAG: N-acetyltransferase [Candidatus Electrothrix sp. GM3_4]|nr:N-acetyltransferase [Candidatus Electrothrix sp. GM3_4]